MIIRDVVCNQPDRGGKHSRVIGETEHRQHVGNEIERQDEIGKRPEQRDLDMARRLFVECAVISGKQIFDEGQPRRNLLQLDPEAPTHAVAVPSQAVGRVEPIAIVGCRML